MINFDLTISDLTKFFSPCTDPGLLNIFPSFGQHSFCQLNDVLILTTLGAVCCTFCSLFEFHLCTLTFDFMYDQYSKVVSNQERVIVASVQYLFLQFLTLT